MELGSGTKQLVHACLFPEQYVNIHDMNLTNFKNSTSIVMYYPHHQTLKGLLFIFFGTKYPTIRYLQIISEELVSRNLISM